MTTIFANVLNIRRTPTELVLEFGSFFPERQEVGLPSDFKPELRVVLNLAVLPVLIEGLAKASSSEQSSSDPAKHAPRFSELRGS